MTVPPDLAPDEAWRLKALRELNIVDTPLDERFERLTRMAKRLLGVDIVAVSLVEADRQYFKSIQGSHTCETSRDISFCGHAILEDDVFIVEDARVDPRFKDNPLVTGPPHVVFYAGVQLHSPDGFKIGMLCVNHSEPLQFTEDDKNQLRDIAAMVELELKAAAANAVQAALVEDVSAEQRKALIDPLTRLWNRQGIMNLAQETLTDIANAGEGCAFVMIDLDGFKPINDTLGHAAGDEVLRVVSKRMLTAVRESDLVGRLGGDEFLCLFSPCEDPSIAAAVAERLRNALASTPIDTPAGPANISASVGVCLVPKGWTGTLDGLIEAADQAMYEQKRAGRNGVAFASLSARAA